MFLSDSDPQFEAIQSQFDASTGVTTDTRAAGAGQLFFALKGENFNGNAYAQQAIEAGCIAAVVDESEHALPGIRVSFWYPMRWQPCSLGSLAPKEVVLSGNWPDRKQWQNHD